MSFLAHIKKKRLSRTPHSGSLPSEDYESKETLRAIDQLVESMEQDEKQISQLDTNRCLPGNNESVAPGNNGLTASLQSGPVNPPKNEDDRSRLKPPPGEADLQERLSADRNHLYKMKDRMKTKKRIKKFASKLAFAHSHPPSRDVPTLPAGEKDLTKKEGVQLLSISQLSKKFHRSNASSKFRKSPSQDHDEPSVDSTEILSSIDSTPAVDYNKLEREEDEGIELKTISSSASVSPDESMSPNLQKEFFPNQFKRKLAATKGAPMQLHCQMQDINEGNTLEDRQGREVDKGTLHSKGPPLKTQLKEDSVTNLSDTSKTHTRLLTSGEGENENPEELFNSMLSSSSSSDCPSSDELRLIFENLKFDTPGNVDVMMLVWKYKCSMDKEKHRNQQILRDMSFLQTDKMDLEETVHKLNNSLNSLESELLQLQKENRNLKYRLQQKQECLNSTKEQLNDVKEQHQCEFQKREKLEFSLRRVEEETIKLVNQYKRECSDVHNFASQEQSAREELQKLFNNCLGKQQELEEENSLNISKCNKALSRLSEASNKEKEMGQEIVVLKEQLSTLRRESSMRENELLEEKELFQEQLEDTRRDFKISTDALNEQIVSLKSKLSNTKNLHENERMTRENLEAELKAARSKMADAEKKVELSHTTHSEIQKTLSQEKEQQEEFIDNLKEKVSSMQKKYNDLYKKYCKAKDQGTDLEKKVEQISKHLKENVLKLKVLEQEKDQAGAHFIMQEKNMQAKICNLQEEKNEIKTSLRKTQVELEESLKKLSVNEGAAEVNKRYQIELEGERARLVKDVDSFKHKMEKDKGDCRVLMEEKKAVESRLHQEMMKSTELQKERNRLHTLLGSSKKKLQDLDRDRSESLRQMNDEISRIQHQREKEVTVQGQLKQEAEYLRDQLDQCVKKNEQLEREALELRYQMQRLQDEQSYTKQYLSDKQKAHQQQPEQLKLFQQATGNYPDQKKAGNKNHTITELEGRIEKLECDLSQVLESQNSTLKELERSRQQYQHQVDTNKALERKLERTQNRLSETNEILFNKTRLACTPHVS